MKDFVLGYFIVTHCYKSTLTYLVTLTALGFFAIMLLYISDVSLTTLSTVTLLLSVLLFPPWVLSEQHFRQWELQWLHWQRCHFPFSVPPVVTCFSIFGCCLCLGRHVRVFDYGSTCQYFMMLAVSGSPCQCFMMLAVRFAMTVFLDGVVFGSPCQCFLMSVDIFLCEILLSFRHLYLYVPCENIPYLF